MDAILAFWLISVLVFGGFTSTVASSKGHNGVNWFVGGALFGPLALLVSFFLGQKSSFGRHDIDDIYRDAEIRARKYADRLDEDRRRRKDHEELADEMRNLRRSSRLQRYEDEEIMEMERSRRIRERYEQERLIEEERERRLRKSFLGGDYRDQYRSRQSRLPSRFDDYENYDRRELPPEGYASDREAGRYIRNESNDSGQVIDIEPFDDRD